MFFFVDAQHDCLVFVGDLVFFEYTYEGPWITHVGIYVGEGYILHAGNPIGYLKFMDSYYSDNFVGFGRLPAV